MKADIYSELETKIREIKKERGVVSKLFVNDQAFIDKVLVASGGCPDWMPERDYLIEMAAVALYCLELLDSNS